MFNDLLDLFKQQKLYRIVIDDVNIYYIKALSLHDAKRKVAKTFYKRIERVNYEDE